jgi:hypothetical protein
MSEATRQPTQRVRAEANLFDYAEPQGGRRSQSRNYLIKEIEMNRKIGNSVSIPLGMHRSVEKSNTSQHCIPSGMQPNKLKIKQ